MTDNPGLFLQGIQKYEEYKLDTGRPRGISEAATREFLTELQHHINTSFPSEGRKDALELLFGYEYYIEDGRPKGRRRTPQNVIEPFIYLQSTPSPEDFDNFTQNMDTAEQLGARTMLALEEKQKKVNIEKKPKSIRTRRNKPVILGESTPVMLQTA